MGKVETAARLKDQKGLEERRKTPETVEVLALKGFETIPCPSASVFLTDGLVNRVQQSSTTVQCGKVHRWLVVSEESMEAKHYSR